MGKLKQEATGKLAPGQNKSKIHRIAMELQQEIKIKKELLMGKMEHQLIL